MVLRAGDMWSSSGYDILGVGVRLAHFRLPNLPRILLLFPLLVLFLILPSGVLPTWEGILRRAVYIHILTVTGIYCGDHCNL